MIYLCLLFFGEQTSGLIIFMNNYLAVNKLFFLSCSTCLFFFLFPFFFFKFLMAGQSNHGLLLNGD